MLKRLISLVLVAVMMIGGANAVSVTEVETQTDIYTVLGTPRASDYLDSYSVSLKAVGDCKMKITFNVFGTRTMDKIGVDKIVIQEWTGSKWITYETVYGSDHDDFYAYNNPNYGGDYTFTGFIDAQYRAVLTVYAGRAGGYDTREITSTLAYCNA